MLRKITLLGLIAIFFITCRDDVDQVSSSPSVQLSFSTSIVDFDTIFTTVGSVTKRFKVYNTSSDAIKISSIRLGSNSEAYFRMNVDGEPGRDIRDVFIAGKDSLFIFVDVTIDPADANLPFLVEDSIMFLTNGNIQKVSLLARGQQAKFITPNVFPTNGLPPYRIIGKDNETTTWPTDTPIVIYGYAVVDSLQHLKIKAGTQIYFHANSGLWVYRYGQLEVEGTQEAPAVFQGDRLDEYKDISGSWDRIWINDGDPSKPNTIQWAVIKNSFIGIQAEHEPFTGRKNGWSQNLIKIENTVIENCKLAGIYGINSVLWAENVLVKSAGVSNFLTAGGGYYQFDYCTFGNYWRGEPRSSPAVFLSHLYFDFQARVFVQDSLNVFMDNCIIYGDQDSEFNIEDEVDPGTRVNYELNYTLVKTDEADTTDTKKFNNVVLNPSNETVFINPYGEDFHLATGSPAIGKGNDTTSIVTEKDIEGKSRSIPTDQGVYVFE